MLRQVLTTLGELAGIACAAVGSAMIAPAAGWIVAGCGIFAVSYVLADDIEDGETP
jgi:hypothetical protein